MVGFEKESAALSWGRVIGSDFAMILRTARALSVSGCWGGAAGGGIVFKSVSHQPAGSSSSATRRVR
jgi:hypothetical protein